MTAPADPDPLQALPADALAQMAAAGRQIRECYRVLGKSGSNVVAEVLRGEGTFYEWDHYPKGDVFDAETHAQYYYHAHAAGAREGEHGHFHTFLRPKGMPAGVAPAPLPDLAPPEGDNDALSHLIGIAMDRDGFPIGLFTTNRWVTGEVWYDAADVIRMLERFAIDQSAPSWPVNIWITAMVWLFRPRIAALLEARDAAVARWTAERPDANAYEDRALEITSSLSIAVEDEIAAVEAELARR